MRARTETQGRAGLYRCFNPDFVGECLQPGVRRSEVLLQQFLLDAGSLGPRYHFSVKGSHPRQPTLPRYPICPIVSVWQAGLLKSLDNVIEIGRVLVRQHPLALFQRKIGVGRQGVGPRRFRVLGSPEMAVT